jgi:hypothetical protein
MWSDNKVRELIAVKVLHTSLPKTTVVAFKTLPLGSYAPMPASSPSFKTILEMVLWDGLKSCRCITPDVISVIKILPFNISIYTVFRHVYYLTPCLITHLFSERSLMTLN